MDIKFYGLLAMCLFLKAGIAISPKFLKAALEVNLKCRILTGASQNMVMRAAIQGNFSNDPVFKQHCACLMQSLGYMNSIGDLQLDAIRADLPELIPDDNKVRLMMNICMDQKDNPEETAFHAIKCVSDHR